MLNQRVPVNPLANGKQRFYGLLLALLLLALVSMMLSCAVGSVPMGWQTLLEAVPQLFQDQGDVLEVALLELRLQRAWAAFLVGASLALAGVMMQTLLRNPLADPYILGVSGGASVGALGMLLFGASLWMVNAGAISGAILIALLLFMLVRRDFSGSEAAEASSQLLLTGVILAFGCSAGVTFILSVASDAGLRNMVFWLIGDLSGVSAGWIPATILVLSLLYATKQAQRMNLLSQYAGIASCMGVHTGHLRRGLFFVSALLTASAVTVAGSIGFIGLVIPHICRRLFGADHRLLLPATTLVGGSFLVIADTIARSIVAPHQLPVGVITAMVGVPIFLFQLYGVRRISHA